MRSQWRRAAAGILAGLAIMATTDHATARPLQVGSELDYPPFALVGENGEARGFSVELFAEVARVMDLEVDFRVGPWGEILADLREGRIDALPFVAVSPERSEYLDFSVPVVVSRGAVFRRTGMEGIDGEDDLAGLRIGVMQDDIAHEYARRQAWGAELAGFPSLEAAFVCLETGACDAVVAPRLQGMLLAGEHGFADIEPAELALDGFALEYAIAVRKGDAELLAALNGGLAIVMADGTFDEIYARWLPDMSPRPGIPIEELLQYAVGALFAFLAVLGAMYWRQLQLHRLAEARGRALAARADDLRRLADRLEEERRQKEAEQRKTERAYAEAKAMIRVIPDLMFRLDAEGRYLTCHDPYGIAFRPFDEVRGRLIEEALPPHVAAEAREAFEEAVRSGEVQTVEHELRTGDGPARVFEAKVAPYYDGGALIMVRDVSEARQRESRLSRAADAVAAASAAKSRFLATMSHELRTPLNAIIGFSEVLCREMFGPLGSAKYREYALDINESGQSLLSLINDVLDFSKIEAGKLTLNEQPVDLGSMLAHKAALMKPLASTNGTRLEVRQPPRPLFVLADELQVQRMLVNLISNAVKFTQGGAVTASLARRPDGAALVAIEDSGVGMSAEQLAHLGEPFYQAEDDLTRKTGGTGLGVCLVREMIAMHGGEVEYDSQPGCGTTVRLIFPAARVLAEERVVEECALAV